MATEPSAPAPEPPGARSPAYLRLESTMSTEAWQDRIARSELTVAQVADLRGEIARLEDELDAVRIVADAMEEALDHAKVPEMPGWTPPVRIGWLLDQCGHANALLRQARSLMPQERPPYTRWDAISDHIDRHFANLERLKREHPPEPKETRAEEAARLARARAAALPTTEGEPHAR